MNFITGLFLNPPAGLTIAEQVQWKKERLMISDVDSTHKMALGFFLDIDHSKVDPEDKASLEQLSHFEWFAGSLTAARLRDALGSFLNSEESVSLSKETRKQISRVSTLLQETEEQSSTIDLARSSNLALPLVAMTGKSFWENLTLFSGDDGVIQALTDRALSKIQHLQPGGKAVFLTGTLLHETLLSIELTPSGTWEVCHYDTGSEGRLMVYRIPTSESNVLQQRAFWEKLYRLKFTKGSSDPVHAHLESLATQHKDPLLHYATVSKQKKNTCHFRCLLALLKDHIVRHSTLDSLDEKVVEWRQFKVKFGQFLLDEGLIQDQILIEQATKKQKARLKSTQHIAAVTQESEFTQICLAYKEAAKLLDLQARPLVWWDDNMPKTTYLSHCHKELLRRLENSLLTMEQLEKLYGHIEDRWVKKTFESYKQRYEKRHAYFYRQLQDELATAQSEFQLQFEGLILSAYPFLNEVDKKCSELCEQVGIAHQRIYWHKPIKSAVHVPITEQELDQTLQLLINNPQMITRLNQRPHIKNVLLQAIQQGKFGELAFIFPIMDPEDQKNFCRKCNDFEHFVWAPILPQIEAYLTQYPDTPYLGAALTAICQLAIQEHDFIKFLQLVNRSDTFYYSKIERTLSQEGIEEEKIPAILECLDELELQQNDQELFFFDAMLHRIEALLKKNPHIDIAPYRNCGFKSDSINKLLVRTELFLLYRDGKFQEIETLLSDAEIHEMVRLDPYPFSAENWQMGVSLLRNYRCVHIKESLLKDLLISSYTNNSPEIFLSALQAYVGEPDFYIYESYSSDQLQFFIKHLNAEEKWIENGMLNKVLLALLHSIDSDESFAAANTICEKLSDEAIKQLLQKGTIIRKLNQYSTQFPHSFLGKNLLMERLKDEFIELWVQIAGKGTTEHPVYVRQRRDFLKIWNLLAKSLDFSNPLILYQQIIKPIFNRPHFLNDSEQKNLYEEMLSDLLTQIPSQALQMGFAYIYSNAGRMDVAQKFYPDLSQLPDYS